MVDSREGLNASPEKNVTSSGRPTNSIEERYSVVVDERRKTARAADGVAGAEATLSKLWTTKEGKEQ